MMLAETIGRPGAAVIGAGSDLISTRGLTREFGPDADDRG
jgi:hypothetical protein